MLDSYYLESIMDSREIQKRIDELESELDDKNELTDEDRDELETLNLLKDSAISYGWEYGITFIHEDYFTEYTQELIEECCFVDGVDWNRWPYCCLDYEEAADELKNDYDAVEIDGVTMYWREA